MATYRELLAQVKTEIDEVSSIEAHERLESSDGSIFVDVRESDEWDEGHIPGAFSLPFDDVFADVGGEQGVQVDVAGVLRGDHDGVQTDRLVAVVLDGDLGLAVGPQVGDGTVLADLGEAP